MEPLSEAEFKAYVVKKAKEYIFGTTDNLKDSTINEGVEDSITPDSVKGLVSDLKKINASLSFKEPLIESKVEPVEEMPGRKFHVGSYENVSIDLKETLMETMNHYNRQKSLKHGKDDSTTNWQRLVEYRRFDESEVISNFYQGMNPQQAIAKATTDYNFAIKNNNDGQANKIAGNLKSNLESQNYNWKSDPHALEILSDFV